jgi:hypothetical protein
VSDPLRVRIRERARKYALRALLWVLGRDVACAACGRPLFRVLPIVWRGELRVIGATEPVRAAFGARDTLEFRHVELDHCPAPERPWVR